MGENRGVLRVGGDLVSFWCPGCDEAHTIRVSGGGWAWDGNAEAPTFQPSIAVSGGSTPGYCCHSFVKAGKIEFLNDCSHNLAGQTVALQPWDAHQEHRYAGYEVGSGQSLCTCGDKNCTAPLSSPEGRNR